MASFLLFPYIVSLVCSILLVSSYSHSINLNTNEGFSISLIHRDSPQSPFYNHSMTTYERHAAAARRSIHRQYHLMSLSGATTTTSNPPPDISTKVVPDSSEYLTTIGIGTPKSQITVFVDTGSGLNWVKGPPFYDSSKSSSYGQVACSESCPSRSSCNDTSNLCEFSITYGDKRTTSGIISHDDFGFDDPNGASTVTIPSLQFGYVTEETLFLDPQNGVLGLNMESESFLSQLRINKFSHCFVGRGVFSPTPSRMYFGSSVVMSNLSTPIDPRMKSGNYYVNLDGISIGDKLVDMPPGVFKLNDDGTGGVFLDTGTTYTMLRSEAYEPFKNEMMQRLNRPLVNPVGVFDFCFNGSLDNLGDLPDVTFRFARVGIQLIKEVVYVNAADGVLCLAFLPSSLQFTTIGNYQMTNLLVGYDLERMEISFENAICSAA